MSYLETGVHVRQRCPAVAGHRRRTAAAADTGVLLLVGGHNTRVGAIASLFVGPALAALQGFRPCVSTAVAWAMPVARC